MTVAGLSGNDLVPEAWRSTLKQAIRDDRVSAPTPRTRVGTLVVASLPASGIRASTIQLTPDWSRELGLPP